MEVGVTTNVDLTLCIGILHEGRTLEDILEVLHIAGLYLGISSDGQRQLALLRRFVQHIIHIPVDMIAYALVGGKHHDRAIIHTRSRFNGLITHGSLQLLPCGRLIC